jgi:hypothetical protein
MREARSAGRFDFFKKICYNKKKCLFYRPAPVQKINFAHIKFAYRGITDRAFVFRENLGAYRGFTFNRKNSHMRAPVGNSACVVRLRPVNFASRIWAYVPRRTERWSFREKLEKTGNVNNL